MKIIYLSPIIIILSIAALLGILMAASVGKYAKYWKDQNALPVSGSPIVYLALGDSTAQGIGATSPTRGYVGLVAARLSAQTGRPVKIINLSKSGAKIDDVLNRQIAEAKEFHPDVVTVEIGANDMANFQAGRFEQQFDSMFQQLPAGSITSDIPFFGGWPRFFKPQLERNVLAANEIIHRLASRHNIELVELHAETKKHSQYPWSYAIDYFHPSDYGYKPWANVFWERVRNVEFNKQR